LFSVFHFDVWDRLRAKNHEGYQTFRVWDSLLTGPPEAMIGVEKASSLSRSIKDLCQINRGGLYPRPRSVLSRSMQGDLQDLNLDSGCSADCCIHSFQALD
jgi:hypothetical protein